jgi:hypothetical protein
MSPPPEDDRLSDKKAESADNQPSVGERSQNAIDTPADTQPSRNQARGAQNKHQERRSYFKRFFYETKVTDWLLALFTLGLVVYTSELVRVASRQTQILTTTDAALAEAAQAAKDANKLNAAVLRPWISIKTQVISDLIFTEPEGRVSFKHELRNTGRSPATHIIIREELYLFGSAEKSVEAQKVVCGSIRNMQASRLTIGYVLFPGDVLRPRSSLPISRKDIDEYIDSFAQKNGMKKADVGVSLRLIECVDYVFEPFDGQHHQTGRIYDLMWGDPAHGGGWTGVDPQAGHVYPLGQLTLQEILGFGSYAD